MHIHQYELFIDMPIFINEYSYSYTIKPAHKLSNSPTNGLQDFLIYYVIIKLRDCLLRVSFIPVAVAKHYITGLRCDTSK